MGELEFGRVVSAYISSTSACLSSTSALASLPLDLEFKANNEIREYLEKTYEIIYQQIDNEW